MKLARQKKLNSFNYLFPTHKRGEEEKKKRRANTLGGGWRRDRIRKVIDECAHCGTRPEVAKDFFFFISKSLSRERYSVQQKFIGYVWAVISYILAMTHYYYSLRRERDWRNNNSIQSSLSSDFGWWYYGRSVGRAGGESPTVCEGVQTRAKSPHVSHTFAQLSSRQPTAANT
jgi:hypothetical protein